MPTQTTTQDNRDATNLTTSDNILPANVSLIISDSYEIGDGYTTEIGAGSRLEIT